MNKFWRAGQGIAFALAIAICGTGNAQRVQVSNPVLSIALSTTWGGAIESVTVLGTEVVNVADVGREIQPALFFYTTQLGTYCGVSVDPFYDPVLGGDLCDNRSRVYAIGSDATHLHVGTYPLDWEGRGEKPAGLQVEGHHEIGPLAYSNHNEVAKLSYRFLNFSGGPLTFETSANGIPVPYVPHAYFNSSTLTRLFGLSNSGTWTEVFPNNNEGGYNPSLYQYRAMAWMIPNLAWGVGLYSRGTLNQTVNFVAATFPVTGTNNLSVVDQTIGTLQNNSYVDRNLHLVVGNLNTIGGIVNELYAAGY